MTPEEAIRRIQDHMKVHKIGEYPHILLKDALDMAIAALREQEKWENRKPLPAFLAPMDRYEGLKRKFLVFKSDTGEMIKNCFVLRPDKDPAAVAALRAYAEATDNETLAADIIIWVGAECNNPLTLDELRQMDAPVWCLCKPIEGGNGYWCICKEGTIITPARSSYDVEEIPNWVFLRSKP